MSRLSQSTKHLVVELQVNADKDPPAADRNDRHVESHAAGSPALETAPRAEPKPKRVRVPKSAMPEVQGDPDAA